MSEFNGRIGHLEGIESPWSNAGGVVKTLGDVEQMAHTGVGWIEAGSYTLEPRIGNSPNGERVYWHNQQTGETFNSLGMPNKGMDVVETEIPEMVEIAHKHNKPLVVNVAPVTDYPADEAVELIARAYSAGADAVLLNAGCPNVLSEDGTRHEVLSHKPYVLGVVLNAVKEANVIPKPIFIRLSPFNEKSLMEMATGKIKSSQTVSAVFTPNTWGGNKPVDYEGRHMIEVRDGLAGKSGPATAQQSYDQTYWIVNSLHKSGIDTISSSGVMNAKELQRRLFWGGAVACSGTTFFYESERGWKEDVDKVLADLVNLPEPSLDDLPN